MSFTEAFKGAKAELATINAPIDKLKRIATYARIIGAELLSTLQIIPYGIRSHTLYRSLPEVRLGAAHQGSISTARNICYGPRPRNTLDIYLPAEVELDHETLSKSIDSPNITSNNNNSTKNINRNANTKTVTVTSISTTGQKFLPVVLFCHGGIWATGEKWHYAPLATRLAQAGIVTAIMSYSLYPTAQASEMAGEVSQALTWTLDSISKFGGDAENITLAGHSAGAQLCAMALLQRAGSSKIGKKENLNLEKSGTGGSSPAVVADARMPRRFVGMAGVYDIAKHYEYEQARGVHSLSTMERAVGGPSGFATNSPSVLLRASLESTSSGTSGGSEIILEKQLLNLEDSATSSTSTLHGELFAQRIGLDRASLSIKSSLKGNKAATATATPALTLSSSQLHTLPPTILQASVSDTTVPWYESADMHWALHDCGIPSKALIYNRVGHGDFVVNWKPLPTPLDVHTTDDLADYAADFVNIVRGEVKDLSYLRRK